jgi:hypothetical protein
LNAVVFHDLICFSRSLGRVTQWETLKWARVFKVAWRGATRREAVLAGDQALTKASCFTKRMEWLHPGEGASVDWELSIEEPNGQAENGGLSQNWMVVLTRKDE